LYTRHLKELGSELNPNDPCVANAIIDGKQCTILWYVDDNKISHVSSTIVDRIIDDIEARFGKMVVTRGKRHTFLGMVFEFRDNRTVQISMSDYLRDAMETLGLNITKSVSTPAKKALFDIDEASMKLTSDDLDKFHATVAKLLYVATHARADILLTVIFLCTRVAKATTEDRDKLKRLLEYVRGTMELTYTLGADNLLSYRIWVDAAFAVHPDMRSHTGGVLSFGIGGLICKSSRQNLNTKSLTKAELVGASDYLPNALWAKWFLQAQEGYDIKNIFFEQDNEAAIRLETNRKMSSSSKTRHVAIRYFFIKDRTARAGTNQDLTLSH
jgi:hypothetical protein